MSLLITLHHKSTSQSARSPSTTFFQKGLFNGLIPTLLLLNSMISDDSFGLRSLVEQSYQLEMLASSSRCVEQNMQVTESTKSVPSTSNITNSLFSDSVSRYS